MDDAEERTRSVANHAGVRIGRVVDDGWVIDFAGVRIGRVAGDGTVKDFARVGIGTVGDIGAPHHTAAA